MLDVEGVLLGKGVVLVVPLGRHAEVPAVDMSVVEDREQALHVSVAFGEHSAREVLGRLLGNAVSRHGRRDRKNLRISHRGLSSDRKGSFSGTAQLLRKTYWERRFRSVLFQSIAGRLLSSGRYSDLSSSTANSSGELATSRRLSSAKVFGTPKRFMIAWPALEKIWCRKGFKTLGSWSICIPSRRSSISFLENLKYGR